MFGVGFFFSLSVFKHSPGLYRIIDFLLVASLTLVFLLVWGCGFFFFPKETNCHGVRN